MIDLICGRTPSPAAAGGSLSPRGDWRMPSDAVANAWLADLETVPEE
jgi:hypothetical protein